MKVNRKEYHMLKILLINLDLIQKEQVQFNQELNF